jgi:hypothetical protein
MNMRVWTLLLWLAGGGVVWSAELDAQVVREAAERGLRLIERSAAIGIEERPNCFTCHHSGLPVLSAVTARARGVVVDEEHVAEQTRFTAATLAKGRERFLEGKGQGGQAFSAGSALWALKLGGWEPDEATRAVVEYLLGHQRDLGHWKPPSIRPPAEESPFSATYVVIEGLQRYADESQRERAYERIRGAREWLLATPASTTEDRVFRLRALAATEAGEEQVREAAQRLMETQRADGGWAQFEDMESDAYATGTVLAALAQTKSLRQGDDAFDRGARWLLENQQADGSWHVRSRSKPFQSYFESGYPHGPDQFISITAACWAVTALLLWLPD